ncbi:hypothetical protein NDU88_001208 [Pleurodeles waltl]|uniref:Reverse transcriptase zinc-binding domain-containing protein n=1 Tax=Pleurodeles waltl TaxID=8319 RepID=A0AAV7KNV8_PLEWA|nr:hypothetical protein NDU88_001208 [Pleurodeles waltl]
MEQREQREGAQSARTLSQVERRPVELRDNETIQGDKFFSLSDHSSWSSNEQLDLEADKTSSEFESEVSSLALGKELQESSRSATVRKKQRKRSEQVGPNKHSTNPLDTKGLQGFQWEYSKDDLTLYDNGEKQPNPVSLETIYQSIMEHREESKLESRRTQMACRKMQIQIRRVAKTCSEFTTRMEEAETRISRLEDEAGARQSSREMMEKQLEDCRRAPEEAQSWRSPNASPDRQPRRHGDASGRRRKSAPEFRVAESEEGHSGTRRDSSSGRNTDPEGETTEKREKERNGEPDAREETERSVNPEYPGRETEERTEEPPREETEDATACHGPGGSWLDKSQKYGRVQLSEIPVVEAVINGAKIGKLYKLLTELQVDDMAQQNERWIARFGVAGEWVDQSLAMAETTFLSANLKTQHYKTLMDLYYTPAKLKKWGISSGSCNQCGEVEAEITHMFFVCPMLQGILNEIEVFLKKITLCNIRVTVMLVVLGVVDSPESMEPALYKIRRFLFLSMAIYRLCIATDWLKKEPPTFESWRSRLLTIYNTELSLYKLKGHKKRHRGERMWAPMTRWLEYQDTV